MVFCYEKLPYICCNLIWTFDWFYHKSSVSFFPIEIKVFGRQPPCSAVKFFLICLQIWTIESSKGPGGFAVSPLLSVYCRHRGLQYSSTCEWQELVVWCLWQVARRQTAGRKKCNFRCDRWKTNNNNLFSNSCTQYDWRLPSNGLSVLFSSVKSKTKDYITKNSMISKSFKEWKMLAALKNE